MTWSSSQRKRLAVERQVLQKYFSSFSWINPADSSNTKIEGYVKTNGGNRYKLRVYVPSDYPNSRPDMVVISPHPLKGYRGQDMKAHGVSSSMHTLSPINGYLQICHYNGWSPNLTLYRVVLKGRLWLEALEGHRRTGKSIDSFLLHMN